MKAEVKVKEMEYISLGAVVKELFISLKQDYSFIINEERREWGRHFANEE